MWWGVWVNVLENMSMGDLAPALICQINGGVGRGEMPSPLPLATCCRWER